jgi:hypothetical protein
MNRAQEMFVEQVQQIATSLVSEVDKLNTLSKDWDENFKAGAANAILDEDLAASNRGINAEAISRIKTFATALNALWTNQAVTTAEHGRFIRALKSGYR